MNTSGAGWGSRTRQGSAWFVLLVGAATLAGCGGNLTAGGFGEATVAVSGDAPGTGGAAPVAARDAIAFAESRDDPEGEMEAEFFLYLLTSDGLELPLSSQPLRIELDVEGEREVDAVSTTVPADTYTGFRIVFTDLEIEVEAGLIVNGEPIVGSIEVELEDGTLTVDRALTLTIRDGDQVEMLVDLNTATWLQAVDPDLRVVAETVVGEAITVVVR